MHINPPTRMTKEALRTKARIILNIKRLSISKKEDDLVRQIPTSPVGLAIERNTMSLVHWTERMITNQRKVAQEAESRLTEVKPFCLIPSNRPNTVNLNRSPFKSHMKANFKSWRTNMGTQLAAQMSLRFGWSKNMSPSITWTLGNTDKLSRAHRIMQIIVRMFIATILSLPRLVKFSCWPYPPLTMPNATVYFSKVEMAAIPSRSELLLGGIPETV